MSISPPTLTSIQPKLWVDRPQAALAFYQSAFGATPLHLIGSGDDVIAQLAEIGTPLVPWPPR